MRRLYLKVESRVLTKSDYIKTSLRAFFLQNGFNYGNYQGLGYANILYPALKKIYRNNEEGFKKALGENVEFFNSNPHFLPFITSLHLVMLDSGRSSEEARTIKLALMGPLAGIGDSLSQFCLAPLFSTIAASLAQDGLIAGPILFFVAMNAILLTIKLLTGIYGYKLGTSIIDVLSEKMAQISAVASMIGVTVISGLAVSFTKIQIAYKYTAQMPDGAEKVVSIQEMLDKIAPALLPALYTILIFYLIKKRKWTTYHLVILTIVVGILGSVLKILA
ncbi:TPA: PTS system mannose/fructose/sorbose family transporter subunit IID [Clostridium perfringens]|uniref:PTS system mannose/fructose/sorbose family transporter subunit IID n=2 Tax=Clostridium perfringens TaxID=1502 RepID=A0AAP6WMI0_CLOPF|nr:PTS system mannose/fructose/sorbose family transporter subunit IID [Clostridium perfringens]EGT0689185.1 PTS system mannose/fructose/sorbose family transporter subunit IID [Clostridium perfringens]EHK2328149.1 PTS system mannose/fructose/sorbose family transporter subunit IID [Clostridium perfringens]EHR0217490.1 PTS system mannose/fructose/sorbose family transporter subunit IID [Clostridium perfringens]EIF2087183.1 PTS system mannose/fructose/sorbose family transporter subunit IID [Clostrid